MLLELTKRGDKKGQLCLLVKSKKVRKFLSHNIKPMPQICYQLPCPGLKSHSNHQEFRESLIS